MSIKAVVFDLDDTLYSEYDYVISGFKDVAEFVKSTYKIDGAVGEFKSLFDISHEHVFDRFAIQHNLPTDSVVKMVDVYRRHKPNISLSSEVKYTLAELRLRGYKLGIITDGRPEGQHAKIAALGLDVLVDKVIITDELGGVEFRKPNPIAYELIAAHFGISLNEMMYVGDNPQKDFVIGKYGVKTVKYNSGRLYEYCDYLDGIKEDKSVTKMSEIINCANEDNDYIDKQLDFIKCKLLEIMDFIHYVCIKENIKYSLSGGTLIGAVRHKGFIPWDDDMDITMLRDEFNKFEKVIDKYCEDSGSFILARNTLRVPNIQFKDAPVNCNKRFKGIKIDIFILDNFPDEERKRRNLVFKLKTLQGMMHKQKVQWSHYSLKGKILLFGTKILGLVRTKKGLIKSYNRLATMYNSIHTKDKFISNDLFAVFHIPYMKNWVENVVITSFQDRMYYIFSEYDMFLRVRYGDYMELPPTEDRVPQHEIIIEEVD